MPHILLYLPTEDTPDCVPGIPEYKRLRLLSLNDQESLAFELGLAWDDISGETATTKAIGLVNACNVRGLLPKLAALLDRDFPAS